MPYFTTDKPLAAAPLTSYRYRGAYGWIMIGAANHRDALRQAKRSLSYGEPHLPNLEIWSGTEYVTASPESTSTGA